MTRSCVFVRRDEWCPPAIAARYDVVIVAARIESSARPGRIILASIDTRWVEAVREAGTEIVLWDWMIPATLWRSRLGELVDLAANLGALGVCLNVEPASRHIGDQGTPRDWRGRRDELEAFTTTTRDLCDARRLELWVTSWAMPPASFGLPELVRPAHVAIPQPYEVHGRTGPAYVAEVIEHWRDAGAREILLGRGAHELDDDGDAWRTPEQIREHRRTTPAGLGEAWWTPAGSLARRIAEIDAMVEARPGAAGSVSDPGGSVSDPPPPRDDARPEDYAAAVAELAEDAPGPLREILLDAARRLGELRVCP